MAALAPEPARAQSVAGILRGAARADAQDAARRCRPQKVLALICATHARFGATSILPTLITDRDAVTDAVLRAGADAARRRVPGFLGLHLEEPHLSVARKGAHDAACIRPMSEADLVRYENARPTLPHLLITVAAETVTPEQIARLVAAGIVVSIGHSDASYDVATAAFKAGATMATHLFNAMSRIGNRTPGVVGAALDNSRVASGLIADGIHVHPAAVRVAMAATGGNGRLFLVDAADAVLLDDQLRVVATISGGRWRDGSV